MPVTLNASTSSGLITNADTSGDIALQNNGTTAVTVTGGNVGIGTTSPSNRLSVVTASGSDGFISVSSPTTETAGVSVNGGTSSNKGAIVRFQKNASTKWTMGTDSAIIGGTSDNFHLYGGGANAMLFSTNGSERMRITSGGALLIGNTTAQDGETLGVYTSANARVGQFRTSTAGFTANLLSLQASGTSAASTFKFLQCEAGSGFNAQFYVRGDGTIFAVNTTVQSISDERLKENISASTDGLNIISNLNPVRFDFKNGYGNNKKNQLGFVAQEIEQVFPEAVDVWGESDEPNNPYKSVGTTALIPVLVKAIQEQQSIINDLQTRITQLENK